MKRYGLISPSILLLCCLPLTAQEQEERPFNIFNPRNLRYDTASPSARAMGMGSAALALSDDASATPINPSGLAFLLRPAITVGGRMTFSEAEELSEPSFDLALVNVVLPASVLPTRIFPKDMVLSLFREIVMDGWFEYKSYGKFVNNSSSPEQVYRDNFPSRDNFLRTQIRNIGLAAALGINEKVKLGATLRFFNFEYILDEAEYFENDLTMQMNSPPRSETTSENLYLIRTVNVEEWKPGFSAGLSLGKFDDRLRAGLVANIRPAFDLEVDIFQPAFTVTTGNGSLTYGAMDTIVNARFKIPDSYGLGLLFTPKKPLKIVADIFWIRYSQLINANREIEQGNLLRLLQNNDPNEEAGLALDDGPEVRLGLEYNWQPNKEKQTLIPVRLGYFFEPRHEIYYSGSDSDNEQVFPKGENFHHITAGLGLYLGEKLRFDGAADFFTPSNPNELDFNINKTYLSLAGSVVLQF